MKKRILGVLLATVAVIIAVTGCGGGGGSIAPTISPNLNKIYVLGCEKIGDCEVATCWNSENGEKMYQLENHNADSAFASMCVVNGKTYLSGYQYEDAQQTGKIWYVDNADNNKLKEIYSCYLSFLTGRRYSAVIDLHVYNNKIYAIERIGDDDYDLNYVGTIIHEISPKNDSMNSRSYENYKMGVICEVDNKLCVSVVDYAGVNKACYAFIDIDKDNFETNIVPPVKNITSQGSFALEPGLVWKNGGNLCNVVSFLDTSIVNNDDYSIYYWAATNSKPKKVNIDDTTVECNSMFISGNKMYIAGCCDGSEANTTTAKVWEINIDENPNTVKEYPFLTTTDSSCAINDVKEIGGKRYATLCEEIEGGERSVLFINEMAKFSKDNAAFGRIVVIK